MEYNTARDHLILPEYGRHVQKMVEYATTLENKEDRNKCVNAIINFMGQMNPQLRDLKEFNHKLWDHLFIMSQFQLDADSPYPLPEIKKLEGSRIVFSYQIHKDKQLIATAKTELVFVSSKTFKPVKMPPYFELLIDNLS